MRPLWEGVDPIMTVQELSDYFLNLVNKGYADYTAKVCESNGDWSDIEEGSIEIRDSNEVVLL